MTRVDERARSASPSTCFALAPRGLALCLLAACALVACGGSERASGTGGSPPPPPPPEPPAMCVPPGLESARIVPPLMLPSGCSFSAGGPPSAPRVITNDAELQAHLSCPPGVAAPVIDLAGNDLYLVTHSLSPAYGGGETRDDGSSVKFVTRFRPNCPDDPQPMPIESTFGILLPKGATRTFGEANCTLPRRC